MDTLGLVRQSKTAHSFPIILNNSYNGVPPAPGTGMAQSQGLSHSSARSRGHPIVAVVQYDWTTVCCFEAVRQAGGHRHRGQVEGGQGGGRS